VGFSVKLAPGVRVRASSRGVRTSFGPRAARVHVGGGRTGFSTGVGPVSYYTSTGGGRRNSGSTARRSPGTAAANRQLAAAARAADKAQQAQSLAAALRAIEVVHRQDFPTALPSIAPPPPPVDIASIRTRHTSEAKAATTAFSGARKSALLETERRTQDEAAATAAHYEQQRQAWQASLDRQWDALNANDPDTVLDVLAAAFEDNEAAAAPIGINNAEVSLVVVIPSATVIPDRRPTITEAGNLSLKKLAKRETSDLYRALVCGHALVTVKEALAVAPGLWAARVVAVRPTPPDAYGMVRPEVVLAAKFSRNRLSGIHWHHATAEQVVTDAGDEVLWAPKGAAQELMPIDLSSEPALARLVEAVDFEDLF
jgi:flagellar motor protein MotB